MQGEEEDGDFCTFNVQLSDYSDSNIIQIKTFEIT